MIYVIDNRLGFGGRVFRFERLVALIRFSKWQFWRSGVQVLDHDFMSCVHETCKYFMQSVNCVILNLVVL